MWQPVHQTSQRSKPLSVAKQQPKENIIIAVSGNNILVQGRVVSSIDDISEDGLYLGLKSELDYQASKNQSLQNVRDGYPVTLIADKNAPYKLLKKIMATCTAASYTRVSLAVSRKLEGKGNG